MANVNRSDRSSIDLVAEGDMQGGLYNVLTWLIVGLAGGSLAALALTGRTRGFGVLRNLLLGVSGALVGGAAFTLLDLLPNLDRIAISARDLLSAFAGSLVVFFAHWLWQKFRRGPELAAPELAAADQRPPQP